MVGMVEQSKEAGKLTAQLATMDIPLLKDQFSRIMEVREAAGQEKEQLEAVSGDQRGGWWSLEDSRNEWEAVGLEAIRKGEVGVILLAGGQGTRLGSSKPKALYDLALPSRKTLLQLQAERVLSLKRLASSSSSLPWYIMTSPQTHSQLEDEE